MKIIIDIPEYLYKEVVNDEEYGIERMRKVVINGTPLPKGHGDLIDRNECLKLKMTDLYDKDGVTMYAVPTGNILRMKPIIEADKEEEE